MESNQLIIRSVLYKLTVLTEDTKQSTTPVINPAKILDSTEDAYDAVVCNFIDIISVIMATNTTTKVTIKCGKLKSNRMFLNDFFSKLFTFILIKIKSIKHKSPNFCSLYHTLIPFSTTNTKTPLADC